MKKEVKEEEVPPVDNYRTTPGMLSKVETIKYAMQLVRGVGLLMQTD